MLGIDGITANTNSPPPAPGTVSEPDWNPGDPDGVELQGEETFTRALPFLQSSPWSGWPAEWSTPQFNTQFGLNKLVDTAWACLDLNSRVLSAMPVYRTQSGRIIEPRTWMTNPDPLIYTSWQEFAKQLFWDYLMGEAFVLPMATRADKYPMRFRVVPPWLMNVEMRGGTREYKLGATDVTADILHIRYQSNTADARGHGPLEVGGARMTAAALLQRYADKIAETGGTPLYWLEIGRRLSQTEGEDLLDRWVESRTRRAGEPALVTGGAKLNQAQSMSARDMTLLELAQFNESRIAILFGVPPFLVGLPSGGDSQTYKNVESLFDFHDRSSLKPTAAAVMSALSQWALPGGQATELNRDEYTQPPLKERAEAYNTLFNIVDEDGNRAITVEEIRARERFDGLSSAVSLTGGQGTSTVLGSVSVRGDG